MPETQERILVIDDEPLITAYLKELLGRGDYCVVTLNDPLKLEDYLLYEHYDLDITDLKMPERDGLKVLETVRMTKPHVPVILMTGWGSIETAIEATRLGAAEYVSKPIEAAQLIKIVNKHARANRNLPQSLKRLVPRARRKGIPISEIIDGKVTLENEIVSTDTVPEGFVEVKFSYVVPGEKLPFSIYIQLLKKSTDELFLRRICAEGTIYTSGLRNILYKRGLASVFIEERDYREYIKFLSHIKALPNFRGIQTLDDKKLVLYGKAIEAVSDILAKPVDEDSVQAAVNFVDYLFRNMVKTPELYDGMFRLFKKESSIFNHAANVSLLAVSFAIHMKLTESTIKLLGLGALYHDIGMMTVDKEIIEKPTSLNEREWEIIKEHPERGAKLLEKSMLFQGPSLRIIREHHEQVNGEGYPYGLRGTQISPMAQLLRIIDKFESMTTNKPYRIAMRPSDAIRQIFKEETSGNVRKLIQQFIRFLGG